MTMFSYAKSIRPRQPFRDPSRCPTREWKGMKREQAMALSNADFFSHQLRERLDRENEPIRSEAAAIQTGWWTIRRLLWGGITSLAVFAICTVVVFREKTPSSQSQYLTQILGAQVDPTVSPNATISMFEKKDDHVTVLWVDGLQSLPPEYAAK